MTPGIELISAFERREELIPLYREYASMLVQTDPVFQKSLEQQNVLDYVYIEVTTIYMYK